MTALTILNVASPFVAVGPDAAGGAEQVVHHLDCAIMAAGHRSLIVAQESSRVAGTLIATPPALPGKAADNDAVWAAHRAAIARACATWPVDLVHVHGVEFDRYRPPADLPVLVTLHMPANWYPAREIAAPPPGWWFNCVSASQRAGFAASPTMLAPIANGIAVEAFAARHARRGFALCLGRLAPEKGAHLALDAARLAGVPLLVAGQVFQPAYFDAEIAPRLDSHHRFIGPVGFARKRRLLAAARCLLVPSLEPETSSLVAMEAAAAGTPVVAFKAGELKNLVVEGRTGFLVDTLDQMAASVMRCDGIDRETCRKEARRRFAATAMTASYLSCYRQLAGRAGADHSTSRMATT